MSAKEPSELKNPKISVYIALGCATFIATVDLVVTGSITASKEIALGFIAFAGLRQAAKSLLNR